MYGVRDFFMSCCRHSLIAVALARLQWRH